MSIERVTAVVLERAARGDALSPAALTFLVRRYRAASQPDVSVALGDALAAALARPLDEAPARERAAWLRTFSEALTVSDDERVVDAARALMAGLARELPQQTTVEDAAPSIEAVLVASHLADRHQLVPHAIDQLERIVGAIYRPGCAVGDVSDHLSLASVLLTAFEVSGRLPYSMLAEELVQTAGDGLFGADFETSCAAVAVLRRIASLHDDPAYRGAAVIKAGTDYRGDAARILDALSSALDDPRVDVARYGLALDEI